MHQHKLFTTQYMCITAITKAASQHTIQINHLKVTAVNSGFLGCELQIFNFPAFIIIWCQITDKSINIQTCDCTTLYHLHKYREQCNHLHKCHKPAMTTSKCYGYCYGRNDEFCIRPKLYSNFGNRCFAAAGKRLQNSFPTGLRQTDIGYKQ